MDVWGSATFAVGGLVERRDQESVVSWLDRNENAPALGLGSLRSACLQSYSSPLGLVEAHRMRLRYGYLYIYIYICEFSVNLVITQDAASYFGIRSMQLVSVWLD